MDAMACGLGSRRALLSVWGAVSNLIRLLFVVMCLLVVALPSYDYGRRSVQAKWDTEKAATATAQRTKEAELQAGMDKLRTEKNRETAKLRSTVAALTLSLRDRPERPAVPASASTGDGSGGCTGATLYRSDSEFLIRFSERADTLRLALITCQNAYQDAVDKSAGH